VASLVENGIGQIMAQSSAAREPTMEEILASIRRIIESNDQPADAPTLSSVTAMPRSRDDEAETAVDPAEEPAMEFPAAEMEETVEVEPVTRETASLAAANQPGRPISLADVAARLRGAPAAAPQVDQPPAAAAEPAPRQPHAVERAEPFVAPVQATIDAAQPAPAKPAPLAEFMSDDQRESAADETRFLKAAREDVEAAVFSASYESPKAVAERTEPAGSALMSVATGSQVAAVFDGLGEAMKKSTMRSFDEIAQDMLRPMLSDWLDDNLPTLVERLVREEIERVARGGRR
jgi:cell pole-organizing protein PopZ